MKGGSEGCMHACDGVHENGVHAVGEVREVRVVGVHGMQ